MTRGLAMTKRWDYELYIDGAWTSDGAEGTLDVIDPATEESIGSVPDGSVKTAVQAITAARRAFDSGPWPWMKPAQRAAALVRMAEILESRSGDLRELIVAETGSTGFLTDFVQAAGSIGMFQIGRAKIGRASCRAGVCQYVYYSGVPWSLK